MTPNSSQVRKLQRAWVITREGTRHPIEVVGILSARKSAKAVREYVEWLYALLYYYPQEHCDLAKYTKPSNPYPAQSYTTNTGIPVDAGMLCGHNPFLDARRAKDISLIEVGPDHFFLKWTNPDSLICDPKTLHIVEKRAGRVCEAPIRLPLRTFG